MKLTLVDIIPRIKRMLKEQRLINTTIWLSIAAGLIEGVALCLLLPCVTALANNEPVWGLGVWGWVIVLSILAVVSAIVGYVQSLRGYQTALDFLVNVHKKVGDQVSSLPLGWFNRPLAGLLSRLVANELVMTWRNHCPHALSHYSARHRQYCAAGICLDVGLASWSCLHHLYTRIPVACAVYHRADQ